MPLLDYSEVDKEKRPIVSQSQDASNFLATFSSVIERAYGDGKLERTPESHECIMEAARLAYNIQTTVSAACRSARPSALGKGSAEQNLDEHSSDSPTAVIWLDESPIGVGQSESSHLQNHSEIAQTLHSPDVFPSQTRNISMNSDVLELSDTLAGKKTEPRRSEPVSTPNISDPAMPIAKPMGRQIESSINPESTSECTNNDEFPEVAAHGDVQDELLAFQNENFFADEPSLDIFLEAPDFLLSGDVFNTDMGESLTNCLELELECGDPTEGPLLSEARRNFWLKNP